MVNLYRNLPNFKGKYKLGSFLFSLPKTDVERECLEIVDMHDGSKILVDLRCPTERKTYFTGQYDYSIIQRLSKVLKTGSTVLDVGANIGFYTIALGHNSRKASKEYSIYAFEPVKANFDRLAHNLNMNGLLHQNIHIFNLALGNQEGQIKLQIGSASESSPTNNAIWIKDEVQEPKCSTCTAEITKLDIFAQQNKVQACDLIKVDIEGAELEFFLGGRNFINKYRPIIWSEFNPYHANRFGYSFREISDLASNWGYDLYKQKKRRNFVLIKNPLLDLTNFLMIPQEKTNHLRIFDI